MRFGVMFDRNEGIAKLYRHLCCAISFCLFMTITITSGRAATSPPALTEPMSFVLVRSVTADCEADCPEWIAAQGEIKPGTARIFEEFLTKLDGRPRPILINSRGGATDDALEMGRVIRARKLSVAVAATRLFEAPTDYNLAPAPAQTPKLGTGDSYPSQCLSACVYVLAAGIERYASPLAVIGIHQAHRRIVPESRDVPLPRADLTRLNAHLAAYLKQMGEDASLIELIQTIAPDRIRIMTPDEERQTELVTIRLDGASAISEILPKYRQVGAPSSGKGIDYNAATAPWRSSNN
jgi:hypothetical protein